MSGEIGVGPHPEPWPTGEHLDSELLGGGDRRNVIDRYRYWSVEAIRADLDARRHPFHVAIENWEHDRNIGTVVRTANAFAAAEVHIVGRRRWNRRGAMMTDVYQHVRHHASIEDLAAWAGAEALPIVGIDNLPGAQPLETAELPERCVLLFGQGGPRPVPGGPGRIRSRAVHLPVRLDPLHQRRRGRRNSHARLDPSLVPTRLSPARHWARSSARAGGEPDGDHLDRTSGSPVRTTGG